MGDDETSLMYLPTQRHHKPRHRILRMHMRIILPQQNTQRHTEQPTWVWLSGLRVLLGTLICQLRTAARCDQTTGERRQHNTLWIEICNNNDVIPAWSRWVGGWLYVNIRRGWGNRYTIRRGVIDNDLRTGTNTASIDRGAGEIGSLCVCVCVCERERKK